jgi:hypothetical protein
VPSDPSEGAFEFLQPLDGLLGHFSFFGEELGLEVAQQVARPLEIGLNLLWYPFTIVPNSLFRTDVVAPTAPYAILLVNRGLLVRD